MAKSRCCSVPNPTYNHILPVVNDLDQGFGYITIIVSAHVIPAMCNPADYE